MSKDPKTDPTKTDPTQSADTTGESGQQTQEPAPPQDPPSTKDAKEAQAAAKAAKAAAGVTLNECIVIVERNALAKVPDMVYEHEIEVLQQVHGADRIEVRETYPVEISGFSVTDEYARLKRRYNSKQKPNAVENVYGHDPSKLAERLGLRLDPAQKAAAPAASTQEGDARRTSRAARAR